MSKVYLYLTRQYNLILLLRATKLVLSTKIMKVLQYKCKTQLMERDALGPVGHLFLYYCICVLYFRLAT